MSVLPATAVTSAFGSIPHAVDPPHSSSYQLASHSQQSASSQASDTQPLNSASGLPFYNAQENSSQQNQQPCMYGITQGGRNGGISDTDKVASNTMWTSGSYGSTAVHPGTLYGADYSSPYFPWKSTIGSNYPSGLGNAHPVSNQHCTGKQLPTDVNNTLIIFEQIRYFMSIIMCHHKYMLLFSHMLHC